MGWAVSWTDIWEEKSGREIFDSKPAAIEKAHELKQEIGDEHLELEIYKVRKCRSCGKAVRI